MNQWEEYYPFIRHDGKFLGLPSNDLIDTRNPRLRCGECKEPAPIYDGTMKYCPWCGKRLYGICHAPKLSSEEAIEMARVRMEE